MDSVVPGSGQGVISPSLLYNGRMGIWLSSVLREVDALFVVFILFKHGLCFNIRMGRDDELGLRSVRLWED